MNLFQRYKKYLAGKLLLLVSLVVPSLSVHAQNNNVQLVGKVVDDRTKEPLVGAVVHIKGTTHHVVADEEGAFTFITGQKVPVVYEVSHVGYETREITISDYKPVDIRLKQGNAQLSDVVVVGYGTQRRSDVSGAVTSVPKNLLTQPAVSFDNLIQGAVPGVAVTQSSAQPGSTAIIRVRGGNSITFGNEPLYVIDGFIIYNNNSFTNTGASNGASVNALATINPSDIESIEILKDASATAIYGSRGANGVVVITTRRGKKGTDEFNYSGYYGEQQVSYKDGWKAAAAHHPDYIDLNVIISKDSVERNFDKDVWELYNLNEDFNERTDLAKKYPEKLKELQGLFDVTAKKYNIYPLIDWADVWKRRALASKQAAASTTPAKEGNAAKK